MLRASSFARDNNYKLKVQGLSPFLPIIAIATFLFYPSLNYYFFQDDWFVLNWVSESNVLDLLKFRSDVIYWRPISMPIFFKLTKSVFDLNPFGFHLVSFLFHFVNAYLIYILFKQLKFKREISTLISFLYATASFHFIPLSWLSTTSYLLGPTAIFTSLILFLKNKFLISLVTFLLGLATSEFTITLIPIAIVLHRDIRIALKKIFPFIIILVVYILIRLILVPIPQEGEYSLTFVSKIITNIFWYFLWTFNIPEAMSTVFYPSRLEEALISLIQFWKYISIPILILIFYSITAYLGKVDLKKIIIGAWIFLAGLSPVIFLPFHTYPMYLVIAVIGVLYILASSLERLKSRLKLTIYILGTLWFISSFITLKFTQTNHWLVNLQSISKTYISEAKSKTMTPPNNSVFIFKFSNIEFAKKHDFVLVRNEQNIKQALNNQDAIQVVYGDKSLTSFYETEQGVIDYKQFISHFIVEPR